MILLEVAAALLLDRVCGEPGKCHPLPLFGQWANRIETMCNGSDSRRWHGCIALLLAVVPLTAAGWWLERLLNDYQWADSLLAAIVLYLAVGWRSLLQHAMAVVRPLHQGRLHDARHAVAMLVSRDTAGLDANQIAMAATESVLENGADAVFSALFWFIVAGVPGVLAYRLTNTLDAMWGYKTERFVNFGWAAARLDDMFNFVPARLTALSYALAGNTVESLRCWRRQAPAWKSPNAGPVMAAGAGALAVSLGGAACYRGRIEPRPPLGPQCGNAQSLATAASIEQACRLVNKALGLWLAALTLWVLLS